MSIQHPQAIKDPGQTLHIRFRQMAAIYPDNTALKFRDHSLNYRQLDQETQQLAAEIIRMGGNGPGRVALYMEHGTGQVISLLSCLKAGKTYVALDPSFPVERNLLMLNNADCELILTNHMNISQVRSFSQDMKVINIDDGYKEDVGDIEWPEEDPARRAFITYTSGSTGIPKGVPHTHRNMMHFQMRMYEIDCTLPDDNWAYYYSLSFSAHAMSIFGALLNGATLSIFDLKKDNFTEFGKWLRQEKISICLMIPSVLREFTSTLGSGRLFPKLSRLLIGGETLYRSDVEKIIDYLKPNATIFNIYASSEAYLARAYRIGRDTMIKGNIVPIGYPVPGMDVTIETDTGSPAEPNVTGEVCITSKYVSEPYWRQDEGNSGEFQKNEDGSTTFRSKDLAYMMPDGCIVHVGRKDSVVKLRGYRIDLGEIENALMDLKQVREAAVLVKEKPSGTKHLVTYYVLRENTELEPLYLKLAVLRKLPDYMVPTYYIQLDHLPKNDIGKVDHKHFPEPDFESLDRRDDIALPENQTEEDLKEIFERSLNVSPLGVTDNILDSGADSLKLFVAFDEVEKQFGIKLNLDEVLKEPRIRDIARQINK